MHDPDPTWWQDRVLWPLRGRWGSLLCRLGFHTYRLPNRDDLCMRCLRERAR